MRAGVLKSTPGLFSIVGWYMALVALFFMECRLLIPGRQATLRTRLFNARTLMSKYDKNVTDNVTFFDFGQ